MPQQQVIWTALPNGRKGQGTGERLKLSVVVAPRLRLDGGATGELQSFPDFVDWPERLRQNLVGFDVIIDDNEARPVPTTIVPGENRPDSELWRALFSRTTPVRSQKFEGIREPIATFPASDVASKLSKGYGKICGDAPFRPADKDTFKKHFADVAQTVERDNLESAGSLRTSLREARALGATALDGVRRELATSLLKSDDNFTFDEKLTEAIEVAGELARSAPPDQFVSLVPETADPFVQFAAFYRRPAAQAGVLEATEAAPSRNPIEEVDFHRMLTGLGDYPWLMRRLGLVIDLEVDASLVPKSSVGSLRHLRVRPRFSSPAAEPANYTPATKYILDDAIDFNPLPFRAFVAAPRRAQEPPSVESTLEIVGGLLNLHLLRRPPPARDLQFDIITVDIDGAAQKVVNALESIVRQDERPGKPIDATTAIAPPALQTTGLTLVRFSQAKNLMTGVANAQKLEDDRNAGRRAILFAEDLVRGYRIDVRRFAPGQTSEPPWLSLHNRIGNFRFKRDGQGDINLPNVIDEGFVQPVLVQDPKSATQDTKPIYIHESFGHWQGWSLSAPFPGSPMDMSPEDEAAVVPPAGLLRLDVTMTAAPATLPRLRFNHHYQVRVRTVDLAGNGLSIDEATGVMRSLAVNNRPELFLPLMRDELRFRRFEPLASPALVLREELLEGEAADVIVVRSNGPPTTTASYAADVLRDQRYRGFSERHIVPPQSSQRMAELHGRLDPAFGAAGDPLRVFAMCRRGAGSLNDTFVSNLRTGEREDLPDVVRTDPFTGTQTTVRHGLGFVPVKQSASDPDRPPEPPSETETRSGYMVHYEEQLRLPYLPDPLARGAALFNLPGLIKNNESLVLVEASGPGTVSRLESKRNQDQLLPQRAIDELGQITKIGFPAAGEWPELRSFRLRVDGHTPASTAPPGTAPTPKWSEVNDVRSLTIGLAPAEVREIWISTYPDSADVDQFGLRFWWDRLGAEAANREFMNLAQHGALAALSPARKVVLVHAVQQPLIAPTRDGAPFAARKFAAETAAYIAGGFKIHGGSTEKLDLLASWKEPLQESEAPPQSFETHVLEMPIYLDREPPSIHGNPVPIGSYIKGTDRFEFHAPDTREDARSRSWLAKHEFGDTRHRIVTYRLVATTRFKEYFPERITRDTKNIVRTTTFQDVIVLNSVRPPALEITSIVPAIKWERNAQLTSSTRSGGRLRVYLARRWFETGEGESLAIVGDPVAAAADPLHTALSPGSGVTIKPKGSQPVTVAGSTPSEPSVKVFPFPVHHDPDLGLWYADLAFEVAGTYFPFFKLKLARFQANSVAGLQLSPVVEAGFRQLLPDRFVTITRSDVVEGQPNKRKIEITVSGAKAPAASLTSGDRLTYRVEVDVEERALASPDPRDRDFGWKRSTTIVPVVATDPALWKGHILVPAIADMERRIVIKEFELFPRNDPPPGQAWSGEPAGGPSRRLVYADVIPVR